MNIEESVKEEMGSCYKCPSCPSNNNYQECHEGYNIKSMQSKNCPCYGHIPSMSSSYYIRNDSDNTEKKDYN